MKTKMFILIFLFAAICGDQGSAQQKEWKTKQVHEITYKYIGDETGFNSFSIANQTNYLKSSECSVVKTIYEPTPFLDVSRTIFSPERARELNRLLSLRMIISGSGEVKEVSFTFFGGTGIPITFEEYYRLEKAIKQYRFGVDGGCGGNTYYTHSYMINFRGLYKQ